MSNFKSMKFSVDSHQHSEDIQNKLFEMGYVWAGSDKCRVQSAGSKFLWAEGDGRIRKEDGDKLWFIEEKTTQYYLVSGKFVEKPEAPTLGLRSKHISDCLRIKKILDAMGRYCEAGIKFPQEWVDELSIINSENI
jgi:hypothetical protein